MSRTRGEFNMTTNYDVTVKKPFDARMLVPTYSDLLDENNWYKYDPVTQNITTVWIAYNGMIVAVADTDNPISNGLYMLFDATNKKKPSVVAENWIKIGDLSDVESRLSALEAIELPEGITIEQVQAEVDVLRKEMESVGYLTKDDLTGYAEDSDVESALTEAKSYTDTQLEGYVSAQLFSEEVGKLATDEELAAEVTKIEAKFEGYATTDAIANHITMADVETKNYLIAQDIIGKLDASVYESEKINYVTSEQLEGKEYLVAEDLTGYALSTDIPSIDGLVSSEDLTTELDKKANVSTTLEGYGIANAYTKDEVDTKLADLASGGNINLDGYATAQDVAAVVEAFEAADGEFHNQLQQTNVALQTAINAITYGEF